MLDTQCDALPWFGLRVKSNFESVASAGLQGKGYEPFVPSYKVRRRWTDRVKIIALPLFPGYVFCRLNPANRLPVLTTPGVVGIVGIGNAPAAIEEREIQAIQAVIASGLPAQAWPFIHAGDKVRVERGPLRGVEGVVARVNDKQSLVVSVTL